MLVEFLLLGLIGENVRGYYSGKGKSGGGKFIGGDMGSKADADKYSELRDKAKAGDADAQKQMEQMRDEANKARVEGEKAKGSTLSSEKIHSVVRNEENRIQKEKVEHAVLVTPDGKIQTWTDNAPDHVDVPVDKVLQLNGAVFTHNHPNGSSLSPGDWGVAVAANLAETRAIGVDGIQYSLKRKIPDTSPNYAQTYKTADRIQAKVDKTYDKVHSRVQQRIYDRIASLDGQDRQKFIDETIPKIAYHTMHAVNLEASKLPAIKKLGLEYSFKMSDKHRREWDEVSSFFRK